MSNAWTAWKAATRFLFWQIVESLTCALALRKAAQRELTAFEPKNATELFASGYALFWYELNLDVWCGTWRPADELPRIGRPMFEVRDWSGIPWHHVTLSAAKLDGRQLRAVPIKYAEAHLRHDSIGIAA